MDRFGLGICSDTYGGSPCLTRLRSWFAGAVALASVRSWPTGCARIRLATASARAATADSDAGPDAVHRRQPSADPDTDADPTASQRRPRRPRSPKRPTLPRGGRKVFPDYRLVGYAGLTGAKTLGRLGTGPLDQRVRELERRAKPYAAGRKILPVLEVIATRRAGRARARTASTGSGSVTGRSALPEGGAQAQGAAAAQHPARPFGVHDRGQGVREVAAGSRTSGWRWTRSGRWTRAAAGGAYGHTTGAELDRTARYLAGLVKRHNLPEKVMVYHQVAASVVRRESGLKAHPGVAMIKSVDGLGPPGPKINTYRVVNRTTPKHVHAGFKLFFTEDPGQQPADDAARGAGPQAAARVRHVRVAGRRLSASSGRMAGVTDL